MAANIVKRKAATEDLVPVAPESAIRRVSLTRVERRNGEWIYGDEVELGEAPHAPRDLRVEKAEGGTQSKGQLVCREIIARQGKPVTNEDNAVLCCFPYNMDWYSWSTFKRGTHKKADNVKQRLAEDPMPGQVLEECSFDPFDSSGDRLTARFVEYARTEGLRVTTRGGENKKGNRGCDLRQSSSRQKIKEGEHYWLYGIVRGDFEEIVAEIQESAACRDLLERGQNGEILSKGEHKIPPMVVNRETGVFEDLCPVILDSSIRMALAGLPPAEQIPGKIWNGYDPHRVIDLVEYIFSKAILALARRLGSEIVKLDTATNGSPTHQGPPEPLQPLDKSLEARIETMRVRLESLLSESPKDGAPIAVSKLWDASKVGLRKENGEAGLIVVCALHRLGYMVPKDIIELVRAAGDRNADAAGVLEEILKPRNALMAGQS